MYIYLKSNNYTIYIELHIFDFVIQNIITLFQKWPQE